MRKFRILCVPPYEGMRSLVENIAEQRSDIELIVRPGNLDEGLDAVLSNVDSGIDAIISRGCTTEMIRSNVNILTCDIAPSVYDVLRIITTARETFEKYAVVGYQSITRAALMLRNIIQYNFEIRTVHSREESMAAVSELKAAGHTLIVGDLTAVNTAKEQGIHGLLVTSGIESIETTLQSTVEILNNYDAMNQKIGVLTSLLDAESSDTVVYDSNGECFFSSDKGLPSEIKAVMEKNIRPVIARGAASIIRHIGQTIYNISGRRITSKGEDFCCYKLEKNEKTEMFDRYAIREATTDQGLPDVYPMEYYIGNSEASAELKDACDRYSLMAQPVLIVGDRGTGKQRFAFYMHAHGKFRNSSFLIIDASIMDEKGWRYLLENDNSPLAVPGTSILFKRMQLIPAVWQRRLMLYLKESDMFHSNRLFFSYTTDNGAAPEDELYLYLRESVNCLWLSPPTLSERRDDIPSLVTLYTNVSNIQHGTQVMGFTADAMLLLQNYYWKRNVDQLFQTVQELVMNSKSAYISADKVRSHLEERKLTGSDSQNININLDRTLEEIEKEIVKLVYKAENMNQSHTAKHLGISRSTVWRFLK